MNPKHSAKRSNDLDRQIGASLRRLRVARRLTQTDLAEHFGLTFQQVQKYEKGANRLSGSRIVLACRFFGITPNELLGVVHTDRQGQPPDACLELGLTRTGVELAQAFNAIPDQDHRHLLLDVAQALARAEAPAP